MNATAPGAQRLAPLSIVWLQRDLRLGDNPALTSACARGAVIPLYILDDRYGGAQRWWLHHSLESLDRDLQACGSRLLLRRGRPDQVILDLVAETGADLVLWNCGYARAESRREAELVVSLARQGIATANFGASLLVEPQHLSNAQGRPYAVFTAFWKALRAKSDHSRPLPAPERLLAPATWPASDALAAWNLRPTKPDWASGLRAAWTPGEPGACERLATLVDHCLSDYAKLRDRPDRDGSSMLSPHLAFGEISPRLLWHAIATAGDRDARYAAGAEAFLRQLGWREFSHHLLHHHADLPERPLRPGFAAFPWRSDADGLHAWQRGCTGYPIVDAGMRQLWQTGWMHNRVRMIVASFLVKDLMLPWQAGAAWFADTLVDADPASNSANWQWVAGCGVDAAPYFRVFNPVLQGRKFDPDGAYVRRFVPELSRLPSRFIHEPWRASAGILADAGIVLGRDYPQRVVDHGKARERALAAWRLLPRQAA